VLHHLQVDASFAPRIDYGIERHLAQAFKGAPQSRDPIRVHARLRVSLRTKFARGCRSDLTVVTTP
jgi:hypothetical protein